MATERLKRRTNYLILVVITLAILAVVNFLSSRHFFRVDLSEGKIFTLSPSTRTMVGELDDLVNIKVYFSKKLPSYLVSLKQQVGDLLDEYHAYARGNLQIEFIDPAEDPKIGEQVRALGIPQVQMRVIEKDKRQIVTGYLGIAVLYEDKTEVIPIVQQISNLEYELTGAIKKVTTDEIKTLGFLSGHKEFDIDNEYQLIKEELAKQYQIEKVDTSGGELVPDKVDTLVVAGPKELAEHDLYIIDQFLMRGGKLLLLLDGVNVFKLTQPFQILQAALRPQPLNELLSEYGVRVNQDLVLDRSMANFTYSPQRFIRYSLPYPLFPRITKKYFNQENPVVSELELMVLPWASSLEILPQANPDLKITELFKTTEDSWVQKERFELNPQRQLPPAPGTQRSYCLGAAINGKFKSFYADREIPPGVNTSGLETLKESPPTQIIVVGNSAFISNGFMENNLIRQFPFNATFFLNAIDWLTLGEDLIGIRSRVVIDRPLKELSESGKRLVRYLGIGGVPLLVIGFGLVRFMLRRKRKAELI
ncbi:MAG: GldG family protein [Deltaproteobacteria bacterium]|nr:MAG: GldG family protein [Deltaproteobacteria bacterium]